MKKKSVIMVSDRRMEELLKKLGGRK